MKTTSHEENWDEKPTLKSIPDEENWDDNNDFTDANRFSKSDTNINEENWDEDECDKEVSTINISKDEEWYSNELESSPSNFSRKVLTTPSPVEETVRDRYGRDRQIIKPYARKRHFPKNKFDTDRNYGQLRTEQRSKVYEKGSFYIETPIDLEF